jgi:archaemetzincin
MAVGDVPLEVFASIRAVVAEQTGLPVVVGPSLPQPEHALDAKRRQYSSPAVLAGIFRQANGFSGKLLGVTGCDLFIPMLSFVYGQAQLDGQAAVISTARLRQEFYGLSSNTSLLLSRTAKEALHELGHTFGLIHCADKSCVMSLSTNIHQVDLKLGRYCAVCSRAIEEKVKR